MAYLSTQETSAIEAAKQVAVEMKNGRQERRGEWAFDEVMFVFLFARTSFSGLYRWRTSIRTKFFGLNAGAINLRAVEYAQNFNSLLGKRY